MFSIILETSPTYIWSARLDYGVLTSFNTNQRSPNFTQAYNLYINYSNYSVDQQHFSNKK